MKQALLFLGFLLVNMFLAKAQLNILFVDDSDDSFNNAENFAKTLDSLGYTYSYFNAEAQLKSPADTLMENFDLVIWHTSTDYDNLQFWHGLEEDNGNIKSYLKSGGMLWVTGNDFLDDRYYLPATFSEGDFPYDYLGIQSFDVESYTEDGNTGLPLAYPNDNSPISGLPTLSWMFSTLWFADGITPRAEAEAVYFMGGSSYVFDSVATGVWFDADSFQTLSFCFDMAVVKDFQMMKNATSAVLEHFAFVDSLKAAATPNSREELQFREFSLYPNPVKGNLTLEFIVKTGGLANIRIHDLQGRVVATLMNDKWLNPGKQSFSHGMDPQINPGLFLLSMEIGKTKRLKLIRLAD
jgi:hypothetical protein